MGSDGHKVPDEAGPVWLEDAERVDAALYAAIARTATPSLDTAMARLSRAANGSVLWFGVSGVWAGVGGARGRRAAVLGLASIGVTSTIVNLGMKPLGRRSRPA